MSIMDGLKKSVLKQFESGVTFGQILLSLIVAFAIGMFILLIYRLTFKGVIFSKGFSFSLVLLAMVTALVIRTISSNLALSLGMVGALSIVRFRTAVKDPVDTAFMFWAITAGIMSGTGLYLISIMASVVLGLLYFLVTILIKAKSKSPYLLIVRYDVSLINSVKAGIIEIVPNHKIKSETITKSGGEITVELMSVNNGNDIMPELLEVEGVSDASLISYEGEFGL